MDQQGDVSEPEDGEILDENEEPCGSSPEGEYEHRRLNCDKRSGRNGRGSTDRSSTDRHSHHLSKAQGHRRSQDARRNGSRSNPRHGRNVCYSRSRSPGSPNGYQRGGGRLTQNRRSKSPPRRASASGSCNISSNSQRSKVTSASRTDTAEDRKNSSHSKNRQGDGGSSSNHKRRKKSPQKKHMPDQMRTGNDCSNSGRNAGPCGVITQAPEGSKRDSLSRQDQNLPVNNGAPPAAILSLLNGSLIQNRDEVAAQPVASVPNVETEPVSDDDSSVEVIPEEEIAALKKSPLIITLDTTDTSEDDEEQRKVKNEDQGPIDQNERRVDVASVEMNDTGNEELQLDDNQHQLEIIPGTDVVASSSTMVSEDSSSANNGNMDLPVDINQNADGSEEEEDIYELELRNQLLADLVEKTAKQEIASTTMSSTNNSEYSNLLSTSSNTEENRHSTGVSDVDDENVDEEENALREVLLSQMKNKRLYGVQEGRNFCGGGALESNRSSSVLEILPGPNRLQDLNALSNPNSPNSALRRQSIEKMQSNLSTPKTRAKSSSSKNRRGRNNRQRNRHKSGSNLFPPTQISPPIGIETHHHRMVRLGVEPVRNPTHVRSVRSLPDNDLRNKLLRNRRNEQQQQTHDPNTSSLTTLFPDFGVADTDMRQDSVVRLLDNATDMTIRRTVNFDTNPFTSTTTASSSTAITYMAPINVDIPSDQVPLQMISPRHGRLQTELGQLHSPYIPHNSPRCPTSYHQLSPNVNNELRARLDSPGNYLIQPPILNSQLGVSPQAENAFRNHDSYGYSSQPIAASPTYSTSGHSHPFVPSTGMNSGSVGLLSSVSSYQAGTMAPLDVDHRVNQPVGVPLYYSGNQESTVAGASTILHERNMTHTGLYSSIHQTTEMFSPGPNTATPIVYGQEFPLPPISPMESQRTSTRLYITPNNDGSSTLVHAGTINNNEQEIGGVQNASQIVVLTRGHQSNDTPMTQVATLNATSRRELHADDRRSRSTINSIPSQFSAPAVSIAGSTCTMMMSSSSGQRPIASTSVNTSRPNEPKQHRSREQVAVVDKSRQVKKASPPKEAKSKSSSDQVQTKKDNKVDCSTSASTPIASASPTARESNQSEEERRRVKEEKENSETSSSASDVTASYSLEPSIITSESSSDPMSLVTVSPDKHWYDKDTTSTSESSVSSVAAPPPRPGFSDSSEGFTSGSSGESGVFVLKSSPSSSEPITSPSNASSTLSSNESTNSSTLSGISTNSESTSSSVSLPAINTVESRVSTSEAVRSPPSRVSPGSSSVASSETPTSSSSVNPRRIPLSSTDEIQSVQVTSSSSVSALSVVVPVTSSLTASESDDHVSTTTNISTPSSSSPSGSRRQVHTSNSTTTQTYTRPVPSSSTSIAPPRSSPPERELRVMNSPLLEICAVTPLRESSFIDHGRNDNVAISPAPDSTTNIGKYKSKTDNKHREIKLFSESSDTSKSTASKASPIKPTSTPSKRQLSRQPPLVPTKRQPPSEPSPIPPKRPTMPSSSNERTQPMKRPPPKDRSPPPGPSKRQPAKYPAPIAKIQSKNQDPTADLTELQPLQPPTPVPASKPSLNKDIQNQPNNLTTTEPAEKSINKSPSKDQLTIPPNKPALKEQVKVPSNKPPSKESTKTSQSKLLPNEQVNASESKPPPKEPVNASQSKPPPKEPVNAPQSKPPPTEQVNAPQSKPPAKELVNASQSKPPPKESANAPQSKPPPKESVNAPQSKPPPTEQVNAPQSKPPPTEQVNSPQSKPPPKEPVKTSESIPPQPQKELTKVLPSKPPQKEPGNSNAAKSTNLHNLFSLQPLAIDKMRIIPNLHPKGFVPIVVPVADGDTTEDEDDEDGKKKERNNGNKSGGGADKKAGNNGNNPTVQQVHTSVPSDPSSPAFQNFLDEFLKTMRKNVDDIESGRTVASKKVQADEGNISTETVEQKRPVKVTTVSAEDDDLTKVSGSSERPKEVVTFVEMTKDPVQKTCQNLASNKKSTVIKPMKNALAAPSRETSREKSPRQNEVAKSPQSKKRQSSQVTPVFGQAKRRLDNNESLNPQTHGVSTHLQEEGSIALILPAISSVSKLNSTVATANSSETLANSKAVIESLTQRVAETRSQIQLSTKEKELLQNRQHCYDDYRSILGDLHNHTRLTTLHTKLGQDIAELETKLEAMKKRRETVHLRAIDLNRTIREKSKVALTQKKSCLSLANEVKVLGDRLIGEKKYKVPDILVENINELVRNLKNMDSKQCQDLQRERGVIFKQLVLDEGAFSTAPVGTKATTTVSATPSQVLSAVTTASTSKITVSPVKHAQQLRKSSSGTSKSAGEKSSSGGANSSGASNSSGDANAVDNGHKGTPQQVVRDGAEVGKKVRREKNLDPNPEATVNFSSSSEEKMPQYITKCSKFVEPEEGKREEEVSEERLPLSEGDFLSAIIPVVKKQTYYENPDDNVLLAMNASGPKS